MKSVTHWLAKSNSRFAITGMDSVVSGTGRLCVLLRRLSLISSRDPTVRYVRVLSAAAVGLLIGLIFYNQPRTVESEGSRINVLLFVMCVFSLFALPSISTYFDDRLFVNRERAANRVADKSCNLIFDRN